MYSAIRDLNVAATLSHTIAEADILLTTQSQVKSNQKVKQLLKGHRVPVHVIKSNSQKYIQEFLREYFQMDQSDEAVHTDIINEINSICDRGFRGVHLMLRHETHINVDCSIALFQSVTCLH